MTFCAFNKRFGSWVAKLFKKIFFERAAVDSNSDGNFALLRFFYNRLNSVARTNVARIKTQFINSLIERNEGKAVIEMNVCNERNFDSLFNGFEGLCIFFGRTSDANNFAPGFLKLMDLCNRRLNVVRWRGTHGLNPNRRITTDGNASDLNRASFPPSRSFLPLDGGG